MSEGDAMTDGEAVERLALPTNPRDLELHALATAARQLTSDSWSVVRYGDGDSLVIHYDDDNRVCFMATPGRDYEAEMARIQTTAAFIVALQPAAVLALLAERDAARAARQRAEEERDRMREALRRIVETRWDMGAADACLTMIKTDARAALGAHGHD